jgi:hypothetical protein
MKIQILMNDKMVIEPNSETERYAIMKLLDCIGDKKLRDVIEIGTQNLFEESQNG